MAWQNGRPGSNIPKRIKALVRSRQHGSCNTYDPTVCVGTIDEFDHVINVAVLKVSRNQANDAGNIQGLCKPCHAKKTQAEAAAGGRKHLRNLTPPGLTR